MRRFIPGKFTACLRTDFAPIFSLGEITRMERNGDT